MNPRWLIFDYVPPEFAMPARQRREARRRAFWLMLDAMWKGVDEAWKDDWPPTKKRVRAPLRTRLPMVALMLFMIALSWILRLVEPFMVSMGAAPGLTAAIVVPLLVLWAAILIIGACSMRPHAVTAVRELGYDICPICWYRLDGQPHEQPRCPECGKNDTAMEDVSETKP